jgi:hypothetical protein
MENTGPIQYTPKPGKFEYYASDLDCVYCANFRKRGGHGCGRSKCEFEDLKQDAIAHGKIIREKGWDKK